jgi:hypothetical protein
VPMLAMQGRYGYHDALTYRVSQMDSVRFNGPARANNPKELLANLKIIRVMIKSDGNNSNSSSGRRSGNGSVGTVDASGGSTVAQSAPTAAVKSAMTLEVLQQLPNTVSVSFRGIHSYEVIDALSEKVCS